MKKYSCEIETTIYCYEGSVGYFKAKAEQHGLKYQQMIRSLIDKYVEAHSD